MFHLASTCLFKAYSPGLVTSLVSTTPYAIVCYIVLNPGLAWQQWIGAVVLGCAISTFIVYSLTFKKVL